ncbi:MAG: DEAD/DEAH box helicase [Candidatus Hydrothermarchaeaceae archaeon]
MKSFSLLRVEIREALSAFGFKRPTEVQEDAIPSILQGKNALLIAPTGTGKTEAALLPVFHRYLDLRESNGGEVEGISILYVTPLRALNRDLLERMHRWSEILELSIAVRHGDTSQYRRRKQALKPPEMLITTPETLQAILPARVMKRHLAGVRFVIVDEIHELAEDKRGAQLNIALERLSELIGRHGGNPGYQRIGLSATIGSPDAVSKFLSKNGGVNVINALAYKEMGVLVERPKPSRADKGVAEQTFSSFDASSRLRRITEFVEGHNSTLIFVNTREMAEVLASRFRMLGVNAAIHHSSLSQEVRVAAEKEFKEEEHKALICTSSLELGIDIGSVDLVIQYKSPRQVTRLLQRIGRSGHRIGRKSKGVIIATDSDDILESLVIASRAANGTLEEVSIPRKPLDVLAHQLVGLALDMGKMDKNHAYDIVKRGYVFKDLSREEFEGVLGQMAELRLIWLEDDAFGKTRHSLKYYFGNLSTIPDEKRYLVKNLATLENVGVLDEAFVVHYVAPGNLIIFKGSPWRVVGVEDEVITVEPIDEVSGAIPSWVGAQIPVPYEVAQEMAMLRRRIGEVGREGLEGYPSDPYTKKLAASKILRHVREGLPLPDDKHILVELFENFAVIHSPFGTRVNQALGRTFSTLLTSRLGSSVALQSDAYRIILQTPTPLKEADIEELFKIDPSLIKPLLSTSLKRTSLFKWKFIHVAKRFGAISKGASYTRIGMSRVITSYEGSPIYEETLREIFEEILDVDKAEEILRRVGSELELEIITGKKPSPLAELGMRGYGEVVLPERAERIIIRAMKKRISERRVELFCLYCAKGEFTMRIKNIREVKCPKCGARMMAVIKGRNKELKRLYRRLKSGNGLTKEERLEVKSMQTSGNLVLSYGKKAIVAQGARGIGPEVAKRVLREGRDEDALFKSILKAERDYARTKQFWD